MIHRHLDYPAATAARELPLAAVVDILDRGDLEDWRPLAAAVARDPHGCVAERIADLVDRYPMYGTSPLWRAFLDRCRLSHCRPTSTLSATVSTSSRSCLGGTWRSPWPGLGPEVAAPGGDVTAW